MTRQAALRGITILATNQIDKIDMKNLSQLTGNFVDLLHKAQREIHLSTLEAVYALLQRYADQFKQNMSQLQQELAKLILASDLQRSTLAIRCSLIIIQFNPQLNENKLVLQQCSEILRGSYI